MFFRSSTCSWVFVALIHPWRKFFIITLFVLFMLWFLTIITFYNFHADWNYYCHEDLLTCYFKVIDWSWKVIILLLSLLTFNRLMQELVIF